MAAGAALLLAIVFAPHGRAQQPAAAAAPPARHAFETRDWYKVKTVGSPAMSPDGKHVAVQVTSVIEAKNTRMNEIWVVSTAAGDAGPVRFSAPGFDSTNPRFSANDALLQLTLGGRNALFRVNPKTGDRKELIGGRRRITGRVICPAGRRRTSS